MNELVKSPFTPYLGEAPKVFVGRDKEIALFREALSDAQREKPSSFLLIGHRGFGKTVLLKYLAGIAREYGFYPAYIGLDESTNTPEGLSRRIYGRVKALMEDEFIALRAKRFIRKVEPKIAMTIKDLEMQLSGTLNETEVNGNNFVVAFGNLIRGRKLCVFTDETQSALGNGVARFLVNTLYAELIDMASNWIFILAGTPLLGYKILEATPADRAFIKMELSILNEAEVKEVIQGTAEGADVTFSDQSCHLIADDSQGMPYYVQLFGDKYFKLKKSGEVTAQFYRRKRDGVVRSLGKDVFETRFKELEARGLYGQVLTQFAVLDREDGVPLNEVSNNLPSYPGPYIGELEAKGYLTRIKRGRYRILDKLFREWICEQNKPNSL